MKTIELEGLKELASLTSSDYSQPENYFINLEVNKILPRKGQPRQNFDSQSQTELEKSISNNGLLQPIVVRKMEIGYEIIAGERRWRAFSNLERDIIPAYVLNLSDKEVAVASIIENVQRDELNPIEKALGYMSLLDEFNLTHAQISDYIGKSRASITNYLRLLRLNSDVIELLKHDGLEMGHARAILVLNQDKQIEIAKKIVNKNLSVRQAESLVRSLISVEEKTENVPSNSINKLIMEQHHFRLKEKFGRGSKLRVSRSGKIEVKLKFDDIEKFIDFIK